jgi:hypothetical protein
MKNRHILLSVLFIGLIFQANAQSQKPKAPVKKPVTVAPNSSTPKKPEPVATKVVEQPIVSTIVQKENPETKKITFGLIAGIQQNSLLIYQDTDGLTATTPFLGTGFNVGGTVAIKVSDNFSVKPQLVLSSKSTSFSEKNEFKLLTVDLPIHFLYHHQNFYMGAGPNIAYGISAEHISTVDGELKYNLYSEEGSPVVNRYKRLEIGASLLMGYEFGKGISVNASYNRGLSQMFIKPEEDAASIAKINTSIISLGIGYAFGRK